MKQTILRSMIVLTVVAVIISSLVSVFVVYNLHVEQTNSDLRHDAQFILNLLNESYTLSELMSSTAIANNATRVTIISADGSVLYDNHAEPSEMENHLDRIEVQRALESGEGRSKRLSNTLGTNTIYYAVLLNDGNVLRFAKRIDSFLFTMYRMTTLIIVVAIGIISLDIWLGERMTERILTPINNIDLDKPLVTEVYDELSPLLKRIHRQNSAIKKQVKTLQSQQEQFHTITTNMTEGLILLDKNSDLIYLNQSALNMFGQNQMNTSEFIGKNLLMVSRDLSLYKAAQKALQGEYAEETLSSDDRRYQVLVSPVKDDNQVGGAIVLLLDITQKYEIEQMRKEFSANVSHELKTPLTAILTYTEMLKNNMVQLKNFPEFYKRIYDETKRMIVLVEDLLKLSRLDERVEFREKEEVDLFDLALQVIEHLTTLAEQKNVSLTVQGEHVEVVGDTAILFEIIYNLCENGIRYNKEEGGWVVVECKKEPDKVVLRIRDNGIGIPEAHQARVFERFYRVDQSHSRKTGGTGLGLAIVKHAAKYHNAIVKLDSKENIGTTITIEFPKS